MGSFKLRNFSNNKNMSLQQLTDDKEDFFQDVWDEIEGMKESKDWLEEFKCHTYERPDEEYFIKNWTETLNAMKFDTLNENCLTMVVYAATMHEKQFPMVASLYKAFN